MLILVYSTFLGCHDHVPSEYYELQDLRQIQKLNYIHLHNRGSLQVGKKFWEKMVDLKWKKDQEEHVPKLFQISHSQ